MTFGSVRKNINPNFFKQPESKGSNDLIIFDTKKDSNLVRDDKL
jgi:hypothetical protein